MRAPRRQFLKIATAGMTGLALLGPRRAFAAWPPSGSLAINPNISNMKVVACNDPKMLTGTPTAMTFAAENAVVDGARVHANMDAMAMQLSGATTPEAAWKAIFRSSKPWASTVVAIKVNVIEVKNAARLAIVEKFCRVMAGFGVPAANIIIYDGNTTFGSGITNYTPYFSTTDASKIPGKVSNYSDDLGGTTNASLPDGTSAKCTTDIAKGTVDIIINIANNKGHSEMGRATLCMKNHFGTFAASHTNLTNYVFQINKSDAILGGDPVRQQLCFVDSLFANKASNTGTPEVMPGYLIMGTFAPAVDYLTVKQVREGVMKCTHDTTLVNSYLTTFGYTTSDPVWVVVPPAGGSVADAGVDSSAVDSRGAGGSTATGGSGGGGTGTHATGGSPASGGSTAGGGASSQAEASSNPGGGRASASADSGPNGSAGAAGGALASGGHFSSMAASSVGGTTAVDGSGLGSGASANGSSGCGCNLGGSSLPGGIGLLAGLGLLALTRRRTPRDDSSPPDAIDPAAETPVRGQASTGEGER